MYNANNGNTVIFHEELDMVISAIEAESSNYYTESDIKIVVKYLINGNYLLNHESVTLVNEGNSLLHLMQFWRTGQQQSYRFQARLTVTGGIATIPAFNANGYITVKQSEFEEADIEITHEPNKTEYLVGESTDFTGLVVKKVYYDTSIPSVDITNQCTYTPPEGYTFTHPEYIDILVQYVEYNELQEQIIYDTAFSMSTEYEDFDLEIIEPTKTEYLFSENYDPTGFQVFKVANSGTSVVRTDITSLCTVTLKNGDITLPLDSSTELWFEGDAVVTVFYGRHSMIENPEGVTGTFNISVSYEEFEIEVDSSKKIYNVGEKFNLSEVTVNKITSVSGNNVVTDIKEYCTFNIPDQFILSDEYEGMLNLVVVYQHHLPVEGYGSTTVTYSDIEVVNPWESENYTKDTRELYPYEPDFNTDPVGDGSYQKILIPYIIYEVDYTNRKVYIIRTDEAAITADHPNNLYVPRTITTSKGTLFNVYIKEGS